MNPFISKGLSLIEVAVVIIFSCLILVAGTGYYRSRHMDQMNLITIGNYSEISMALSSYIKINSQDIKSEFFSNGGKPWKLDVSCLYPYMLQEQSDSKLNKFLDGYGNNMHVLISLYKDQIYGLIVDDEVQKIIPADYLGKLKVSIGNAAGSFDNNTNTLVGISDSWSFPLASWSVSGVDLKNSNLLFIVYDKRFSENEITSLNVTKSEAGKLSHVDVKQKQISWEPLYTNDSIAISYHKSDDVDCVEYSLSSSKGYFLKSDIYANSFLITPQASWVVNGDLIKIYVKAHHKYKNTFSDVLKMNVLITSKTVSDYLRQLFKRIEFDYSYSGFQMVDDNKYKPSQCSGERDLLLSKITGIIMTPSQNEHAGNLLIPVKFKLTYSNFFDSDVTFFLYAISSTTDFYSDSSKGENNAYDLASGQCSDKNIAERGSVINLYLIDFAGGDDIKISSKNIGWNISGIKEDSIVWSA